MLAITLLVVAGGCHAPAPPRDPVDDSTESATDPVGEPSLDPAAEPNAMLELLTAPEDTEPVDEIGVLESTDDPLRAAGGNFAGRPIGKNFAVGGLTRGGSPPRGSDTSGARGIGSITGVAGPSAPHVMTTKTAKGGFARGVQREMRRLHPRFKRCYESALSGDPNLKGRLVVKFTVTPSGNPSMVKVQPGLEPSLDSCVASQVYGAKFPTPEGGKATRISYPLVLQPTP